jgi:hypothetical protein
LQFLNSVLSSIGGDEPAKKGAQPAGAPPQSRDTSLRNGSTTKTPGPVAGIKRKAEGVSGENRAKAAKTPEPVSSSGSSKPQASVPAPGGYSGTSRAPPKSAPAKPTVAKPAVTQPIRRPTQLGSKLATKPTTLATTAKPAPAVPSPATPSGQPKKNSFKEILARAQGQQSKPTSGTIQHKRIEQPTKLSKKAQAEEAKKKVVQEKEKKAAANGPKSTATSAGSKASLADQKKKPVEVAYKGTMRPNADTGYKGTMRPGNASRPGASGYRGSAASRQQSRYDRYASDSEDMEDEEEDYESDVSSDMEAGAFDVDQEESFALAQARREDLEAQKEEEEHQRKKNERKKKLAELASRAKPRY